MKKEKYLILLLSLMLLSLTLIGQDLKPYTIGAVTTGSMTEVASKVEKNLKANGFQVLGSYQPVDDQTRWVIAYTSSDILNSVKKIGGLSGFASAWRVAITDEDGQKIISYTTPEYWGNAYFRDNYSKVASLYEAYSNKIKKALAACGTGGGEQFGSEKGHDLDKLRDYKYMMAMPKFGDTKLLNEFSSYADAVSTIDNNLADGVQDLEKVYAVELKDQKIKLYGIGLSGDNGEASFMDKIDVDKPKYTAFLPYEILVVGSEVHMLHGRYRIALSFPDLKMGQFMKIVSTPPNIKKLMERATF